MDKFVQFTDKEACDAAVYSEPGLVMDYYDGNTVTGAVELRPALRDERQLLQHDLRAVHAGRAEPGLRPDRTASTTPTANGGDGRHARRPRRRRTPTPGRRHRHNDPDPTSTRARPPARHRRDEGPQHRRPAQRQGRHLGLVPGRLPADVPAAGVATAQSHTTSPARRSTDYIPHHEPFQYYRRPPTRTTCRRPRSARSATTDQANHQYDLTRLLDAALTPATCRR